MSETITLTTWYLEQASRGAPDVPPAPAGLGMPRARRTLAPDERPDLRGPMSTLTMYTTTWCGYCARLKKQLDSAGIAYDEVDVEQVPDAASFVESVNGGNRTVPTLVFPDGSAATNPSLAEVRARLAR